MRVASLTACLLAGVIGVLSMAGPTHAAGLGSSSIAPLGDGPAEGEPFEYVLTLRNESETTGATIDIDVPTPALFVGVEGLTGATFDPETRRVRWEGRLPGQSTGLVTLTFLARADTGGHTASLRVTVRPWQGEATYLSHMASVDSRPARAVFSIGRVGVAPAGVAVLAWLLASAIFWLILRGVRPRAATWAPIAIMLPLAFLAYFTWLASEDLRILRLPQQRCTVLDHMLDTRTSSSNTGRSRSSTVYQPRLAVRYMADGEARVAQGFGTDSRLSSGSALSAEALLATYAVGRTVACAIDDRDPRRAYVERGFGGAYFFALIPLPVLALGVWGLSSEFRRP